MKRSVAAVVLVTACTFARTPAAHTNPQPVGRSHPEPDPACFGVVAQCRAISGLQQVVMTVGVNEDGKVAFLDVLTPSLTAEDAVEIRRALEGCAWKPAVGPNGERVQGKFTLAIQR